MRISCLRYICIDHMRKIHMSHYDYVYAPKNLCINEKGTMYAFVSIHVGFS